MKSVSALVYYDDDMIPSHEGIMFECPTNPKITTISEDMSLAALRKTIVDTNRGCKILIIFFYRQPIYVGDGCVEYDYIEIKCDNDDGKMFFFVY